MCYNNFIKHTHNIKLLRNLWDKLLERYGSYIDWMVETKCGVWSPLNDILIN